MERIISIIDKPCFYSYKEGDKKLCGCDEYTAIVEDKEGKVYYGAMDSDELASGHSISELVDTIKDQGTYEEISNYMLDEFIANERELGGIETLDIVYNILHNIAISKQKVEKEVLNLLSGMNKFIKVIIENQSEEK